MAIFKVEVTKNYTVMSNRHLRDKNLSLKAKGLLSQMLSLPEDWDYTLKGLALINREKIDAIREAVRELEQAGYVIRSRERDEKGCLRGTEYVIYEQPQLPKSENPILENPILKNPTLENPTLENPTLENPTLENPTLGNPTLGNPTLENPTQINKDIINTDKQNKDISIKESIPIRSKQFCEQMELEAAAVYKEIIKSNIEYDILVRDSNIDQKRLDEIVELIQETVCSSRKRIWIAGDEYPAELVKAKFLKLDSSHIQYVFECMKKNTTEVRNIRKYMLAVLFNAPSTIDNYYTALVNHDMANLN